MSKNKQKSKKIVAPAGSIKPATTEVVKEQPKTDVEKPATDKKKDSKETHTNAVQQINEAQKKINGQQFSGNAFSADSMTRLGCLMQDRYVNGNNLGKQYPNEFLNAVNDYIDVCVVGALVFATEEARSRGGKFKMIFSQEKLEPLRAAATSIGITLPDAKLLPTNDNKEGTQLEMDFSGDGFKLPNNIKEAAEKEVKTVKEAAKKEVNLDPKKMKDSNELKEAVNYILADSSLGSFAKRLATAVGTYVQYYINDAHDNAERVTELANRPVNEWIEQIFGECDGNIIVKCLGAGMYSSIARTHCPIGAFLLLRKNLMDGNNKPIWANESIALAVNGLVKIAAEENLKIQVNATGKPKSNAITDIKDDKNLDYLTNFEESVIDDIMNPDVRKENPEMKTIYGLVLANFFKGYTTKTISQADVYKDAIRNRLGAIANLFRPVDAKFNNFTESLDAEENEIENTKTDPVKEKTEEKTTKEPAKETGATDKSATKVDDKKK